MGKWVNALAQRGHQVNLLTMEVLEPVEVPSRVLPFRRPWGYYLNVPLVRRLLHGLRPDVLEVDYASGYGTLGRLAGYRPCVLSVWGSDVFAYPYESFLNARNIRRNLRHYDHVCTISRAMTAQTLSLCPELGAVSRIPFGVDTRLFRPEPGAADRGTITIGTVKMLEEVYGVDLLVKGFALCRERLAARAPALAARLRLLVVGGGSQLAALEELARGLGLGGVASFTGLVPYGKIPEAMRQLDVYVAMSRAEGFGVAVVEASATGLPVVAARVGGLPEVVEPGATGYLLEPEDVGGLAEALEALTSDPGLRRRLGDAGRSFVQRTYEWEGCVDKKEAMFRSVLEAARRAPR